ncbi:MAG TPA: aminotransferase class V-fold PLP-dependent enzyme [Anaerolineae bacterium]
MSFESNSLPLLTDALQRLDAHFGKLPSYNAELPPAELERMREVLLQVADRLQDNFPYQHPLYAGQMLKPPHPMARLAYMLSLWVNPNNHALDGGRASSFMEKEAVAHIAAMFGWTTHLGHLTGGGTMANLEALWVSGKLHPGKVIIAAEQAHDTHRRISEGLGLPVEEIRSDRNGRMDLAVLKDRLAHHDVGMVVVTLGTTALGSVDPLHEIVELQREYGFRIHVDAAYGGYFVLADNLRADTRLAYAAIGQADSIAIDPHKHGLQPYGCGCILFKDPGVGVLYKHDSPYTYYSSAELHLGEISLECSRPGASAVALWATQQLLPSAAGGVFAGQISQCRRAALELHDRLQKDSRFMPTLLPELDIIIWAPRGKSASEVTQRSRAMFHDAAEHNLHLALVTLPQNLLNSYWPDLTWDQDNVVCLRSCLMKPEHLDWVERIWAILTSVAPR